MTCEEILVEIENRCKGLSYVSDTNAEVHAFETVVRGGYNAQNFLNAINAPPLSQQLTFDELLNPQIELDESGAWETLKAYLEANLTDCVAFKVGDIQIDIYAVGMFDGKAVGIKTNGVET